MGIFCSPPMCCVPDGHQIYPYIPLKYALGHPDLLCPGRGTYIIVLRRVITFLILN